MKLGKLTVRDVPLDGQTVLVREGYDMPLDDKGNIADDLRIRDSLPTIQYLLDRGCKVVLIAHMGRPHGERDPKLSMEVVAKRLAELLGRDVRFVNDCVGDRVKLAVKRAPKNSIIMLENLRFHVEEEDNDREFAKRLAEDSGARYFVQDAFSNVHRAHASMSAITEFLPSISGLLVEREVTMITEAMQNPTRPLVAILGGAKVSDKIKVINAFVERADQLLIGGAMANTFLAANGLSVGKSKVEPDDFETVKSIEAAVRTKVGDQAQEFLRLPTDVAVATSLDGTRHVVSVDQIGSDDLALDIGDATIEDFVTQLASAKTVIWNGTLGYAENPEFAHGSARVALTLAQRKNDLTSIIGGGDTADFVLNWDADKGGSFTHVSTGGGASLELMAGEKLPGIESLLDARG